MFSPLRHAIIEGREAARLAEDIVSGWRLRRDFFTSRLLKWVRLPGYNTPRAVKMAGAALAYRLNRGDLQSLREVFVEEVYTCDLPFVPENILDLGANIGMTAVWLAKRYASPFLVAVEPIPANAALAKANLAANSIDGRVIRSAVGMEDGSAWFEARIESNLGRLVEVPRNNPLAPSIEVPMIGIESLLPMFPDQRIDLVKMDIEGGEQALLSSDLTWLDRVRSLMVEWHDDRAPSPPLIANVVKAGFVHRRINSHRQDNLSLFVKAVAS